MGCGASKRSPEKISLDHTEQDAAARHLAEVQKQAQEARERAEQAFQQPIVPATPVNPGGSGTR
jgi:hypothetical protein